MTTFVSFNSELDINNAPEGSKGDMAVLHNRDSYAPHSGYQIFTWCEFRKGWFYVGLSQYNAFSTPFKALLDAGLVYIRSGEKKWSFENCKFI